MQLFLSQTFNEAIFAGEIIASVFIILLMGLVSFHFKNKPIAKVLLMGAALVGPILIGQGIGNAIHGGPVFGILPTALLASFFFNTFQLLPIIILAQIIGSLWGCLIFRGYKYAFQNFTSQEPTSPIKLTNLQFFLKESIAQIIFISASMFITFATFNNGLAHIDISPLVKNLILLTFIISLFLIFMPAKGFMICPIVSLFAHLALTNNFENAFKWSKNIDAGFLMTYTMQTIINILVTIIIGVITNQIKWWD